MNNQTNQPIKPLATSLLVLLALTCGQALAQDGATTPAPIPYSTEQVISEGDTDAVIAAKAAKVLPRANQTDWMRLERTFFLHFGVNTFNGVEWGSGHEDPSIFNPTKLDANQWCGAMQNFGGKMIVLVCKHHDGFCYWPTRYTPHSVAASPWRSGKGDEVREVANAALAHGLKLGIYLSPADLYQLRTNPKNPSGYYGDGSSNVLSVIPTDPASFKSNPANGRAPTPGFTNYICVVDDYNRYFLNQLYELLTEYGPIGEVWFDGANPDPSVHETYNYQAWYDLIRSLQPNAVIMGKGPDVRWVGNEGGVGRTTEWSVIPLPTSPDLCRWPDLYGDLGGRDKLTPGSHLWWYPAEVNVTILANGAWFWAPQKHPRSLSELADIYYRSIGRNGNLILNLSPDTRGLIPDDQLEALDKMAQVAKDTFANDLAAGGQLTADNSNDSHDVSLPLDGNLDTWWEAAPGQTTGTVTLTLPKAVTFDVVSLQEAVDHRGQRIESFVIEAWNGSAWINAEKIQSDELTTVGHRRLILLKAPVTTEKVRIRITGARLEPTLAEIGLFKQSIYGQSPAISDRDADNLVTISNPGGGKMVYTVDGTEPATRSPVYTTPIKLPLTGTVKAACVMPNGQLGIVASKTFAGLPPTGWKVVAMDSEEMAGENNGAANAIDGKSSTFWHTRWNEDLKLPHSVTIDMGASHRIAGFTYLPRQDGTANGTVENYRFETSADGTGWTTNIVSGTFANIRNNPSLQQVTFAAVNARFFRFTACGRSMAMAGRARRKSPFCPPVEKGTDADFCMNPTHDNHMKKFNFCIFQPIITATVLVLAGCASSPEIHKGLANTTPVTQNRDYAIYDWQSRHAAVIEFNRTHKPEIVLIGDSIIHYWGGNPVAPKAWASDVWNRTFAGMSVENLGFGWDRTENVLWRINHGELDGISPKLIIIEIGTNNTGINGADDIADGIEAVCVRVHEVQPRAKIFLLGILPRHDEVPPRPVITDRVNQLLQTKLGKISWIYYRDFGPAFRNPDGSVNAALFGDGVHPNHAGYEILGNLLHEQIVQILN